MLVNALRDEEGNLTETKERTGIFAWKNPVCHSLTELRVISGLMKWSSVIKSERQFCIR